MVIRATDLIKLFALFVIASEFTIESFMIISAGSVRRRLATAAALALLRSTNFARLARPTAGSLYCSTSGDNSCASSTGAGLAKPPATLGDKAEQSGPRLNFYSLTEEMLQQMVVGWGQPKFRSKQVWQWVYDKGVLDFSMMKDLPLDLRSRLDSTFVLGDLSLAFEQTSKDGTIKRAYELRDGQVIESVLMPYEDGRRTACISSQAGCGMGCVFCATGQMGFSRQLSSTEIFEQAQRYSAQLRAKNERLSNVVMMGMGEPLANYDNVMEAIRRMNDELGIGARSITISTVGLAPRIRMLAEESLQVGLAVSLHQATDEKRSPLMPVNRRYNIEELISACRYYVSRTNRRVSFEWALIRGETDTAESANELGALLQGLLCHVNVIPLNPTQGYGGRPSPKVAVDEFCRVLTDTYGVPCTPRTRRGIDIDAGCGQLKAELIRRKKALTLEESTTLDEIDKIVD